MLVMHLIMSCVKLLHYEGLGNEWAKLLRNLASVGDGRMDDGDP